MPELKNNPIPQRVNFIAVNKETGEPLIKLSIITEQNRTYRFVLDQKFFEQFESRYRQRELRFR